MEVFVGLMDRLPALHKSKSPNVAAIVGFIFGGIGLGLYFWSIIDFIFPIIIGVVISVVGSKAGAGNLGVFVGAICAAAYGYFRALSSNRLLECSKTSTPK